VEVREVVEAIGAPSVEGVVAPKAAPHDTVARSWPCSRWIPASQIRAARRIRRSRIPVPTPLDYIPRHVIQTIPVRRKGPHRTRVWEATVEVGVVATIRTQVITVTGGVGVVVGLTFRDDIAPRKTVARQASPRRLLPLRFRRQPIPVVRHVQINTRARDVRIHLLQ